MSLSRRDWLSFFTVAKNLVQIAPHTTVSARANDLQNDLRSFAGARLCENTIHGSTRLTTNGVIS